MNIFKKHLLVALIVSMVVGGIFTVGQSFIFGGGAIYLYDEDYANIDKMSYSEAQEYLEMRTKEISGYESFLNGLKYPHFWQKLTMVWFFYTIMCFLSCVIYSAFHKRNAI